MSLWTTTSPWPSNQRSRAEMNAAEISQRCRAFIETSFLYMRPGFTLEEETSLLEHGIVDSMGVMELIEFLEGDLGVRVDDDEIIEENLGTLAAITTFVVSKRSSSDSAAPAST
jgi:acyl carrier protein